MAFEVFKKRMVPLANAPYITIQKRGTVSLNKAAHHLMGDPEAVELMYDPDESVVGFRGVDQTVEHAYSIRTMGGSRNEGATTYMVSGTAFFKYFGIDTSVATRYSPTMKDDVLCVDLKEEGTDVTGYRDGRSKERAPGRSYGR